MPTLDSYITAEARNTAYRLRHFITESQLRNSSHTNALIDLYKYKPILGAPNDFIKPIYIFERNYKVIIPSKDDWENERAKIDYLSHLYFADGSKRTMGSGYGVHMSNDSRDLMDQCGEYAEITQAEIIAIEICCLDDIRKQKQQRKHTHLQRQHWCVESP